jgi:hypothetical protein
MLEQMADSGFAIQRSNGRYEGAKPTGRFARPE